MGCRSNRMRRPLRLSSYRCMSSSTSPKRKTPLEEDGSTWFSRVKPATSFFADASCRVRKSPPSLYGHKRRSLKESPASLDVVRVP